MPLPLMGSDSNVSVAASNTSYLMLGLQTVKQATEAHAQFKYQIADELSRLRLHVITNDRGSSTFKLRKNGADGNQSITIGASATGTFEATGADSIAAADLVCAQLVTGSGGTTFTMNAFGVVSKNRVQQFGVNMSDTETQTGTIYMSVAGTGTSTAEADKAIPVRGAGTISHYGIYFSVNGKGASSTLTSRVNSGAGNCSVTIGAGATGLFVDDTHSDTVAVGDTFDFALAYPDANLVTKTSLYAHFVPSGAQFGYPVNRQNTSATTGQSVMYAIAGGGNITTVEADVSLNPDVPIVGNYAACNVVTNTANGSSTFGLRMDAATVLSVTVGASATGTFSVTSPATAAQGTTLLALNYVVGGTGTTTFRWMLSGWAVAPSALSAGGAGA